MILTVTDLKKHFETQSKKQFAGDSPRTVKAVDGVTLSIRRAETLGLVGESGSGKTTVARCILRLEEPTEGRIHFRGRDFLALKGGDLRRERRFIQAVFQDPYSSLNPKMRVGDILQEPLRVHGLGNRADRLRRVAEMLAAVGLESSSSRRYPSEFSGGERQRIAIARALCPSPEALVADEPVSALDVSVQGQILRLLADLRKRFGLTMLFISHALPAVRAVCDRTAVMLRGRIVEMAPTERLFENPLHPYTQALLSNAPELDPARRRKRIRLDRKANLPMGSLAQVGDEHFVARAESESA